MMTEQQLGVLKLLRIFGPIVMFCIVAFMLSFFTLLPLVLCVVLASFAAIFELVTFNWIIRRQGGGI